MSKIGSTDDVIHPAQDLIHAMQNSEPFRPLVTLGNAHKEALISIADIFEKVTSPSRPLMVLQT